jgi:hypothetical protein
VLARYTERLQPMIRRDVRDASGTEGALRVEESRCFEGSDTGRSTASSAARLAELLADYRSLAIVIAGRDLARAAAFCTGYRGAATVRPLRLDRRRLSRWDSQACMPDLVVDASGPFQQYGTDAYRVVRDCIAARVDYLDFADGADFVSGIRRSTKPRGGRGVRAVGRQQLSRADRSRAARDRPDDGRGFGRGRHRPVAHTQGSAST